jgi:hypothetical protein
MGNLQSHHRFFGLHRRLHCLSCPSSCLFCDRFIISIHQLTALSFICICMHSFTIFYVFIWPMSFSIRLQSEECFVLIPLGFGGGASMYLAFFHPLNQLSIALVNQSAFLSSEVDSPVGIIDTRDLYFDRLSAHSSAALSWVWLHFSLNSAILIISFGSIILCSHYIQTNLIWNR